MAFFQIEFFSFSLGKAVMVNAFIPQGRDHYKTLLLLHGLSDDHSAWQRYTRMENYAEGAGLAVIMPNVDRSFYVNTAAGDRYFDFVANELPETMCTFFRGMTKERSDNFVAGLSMGGYGAFKTALTYPDRYAAACSLSGALDIPFLYKDLKLADKKYFENIFGAFEEFEGSENDLFALLEKRAADGVKLPKLFMTCGSSDAILPCSRSFYAKARALSVDVVYKEAEGTHNWTFWDRHIRDFVDFIARSE